MSNFPLARNERMYLQLEDSYGVIPNVGGAATIAGSDACLFSKLVLTNTVPIIPRPDKTGSRSIGVGQVGRKGGTWSIEASLAGSGAAGTPPDIDVLLHCIFGKAGTIVGGSSVTYNLEDAIPSFTVWSFRDPVTADQRVAHGCVVREASIELGGDVAMIRASGECQWVLGTSHFGSADSAMKGGLITFPNEPGNPTVAGNFAIGFTGAASAGGTAIAELLTATINISTANETVKNTFGTFYPIGAEGDERVVSVDFRVHDSDAAVIAALKTNAISKTVLDMILQIGTVPGNIWTPTLNNVQLEYPEIEDSERRWASSFRGCRATPTTLISKDELVLAVT